MSIINILKHPSAWIPIVIPLIFFAYIVAYIAIFGIVRSEDEGTAAHLFQLWLVSEPFMVGYFAVKWLPRTPKLAFIVLIMQILAAIAPCVPIYYFNL